MPLKSLVALAVTVVIWGIAPAIIRAFSLAVGPHDSIFIRLVSVALVCLCVLPFSGWRIAREDWLRLVIVSWIGIFGYFMGSIYGFTYITSGPGGLLMATQPLMIAGLAAAIGTDRLRLSTIIGFSIAFAGTIYLLSGDLSAGGSNPLLGALFILACSAAFAINVVFSRPLARTYGPLRLTAITMLLTAIPALVFYRPDVWTVIAGLDLKAWGALFYLGPVGTIFAVVLWNRAVASLPPSTVGGSLYVIPILSALSGWLLLAEPITLQTVIAGAIILAGVAFAEYGKALSMRRPV
jgi:drug/metabolite transporter (DMT)-like permease